MLPLGLSFALLVFWTVVGASLLVVVRARLNLLQIWLLAPAVGLAVEGLCVAILNQAGLPVQSFAWPLAIALTFSAAAGLFWRRPTVPGRALRPFWGCAALFVLWAGWPALRLGFNWISYVNDDFTNYCLSAERFRTCGFFRLPTLAELAGRDYTQYYWFMHILTLMRFGSEQALAFVGSLTGMNSVHIFMPLILALGAAQICAASGLVLHQARWRRQARWTALLLALSPLFVFGALYQLIAQVGGLPLMLAGFALLAARFPSGRRRGRILAHAIPTAIVGAALALFYPEITPFLVLSVVLFMALEWWSARRLPGARIVLMEYSLVGLLVALRYNFIAYLYTLAHQFVTGTRAGDLAVSLFPFYLIPSGFAMLFGFQSLTESVPDPFSSALILLGAVFLAASAVWAWRGLRGGRPIACLLAVDLVMAVALFRHGNDFGLYKLAMFIQPVLFAGLAGFFTSGGRRWLGVAGAVVLVGLGLRTTLYYTVASTGMKHMGITEMEHASEYLGRLPPAPPPSALWASGVDNIVTVKLAANLYRGSDVRYLGRDFFVVYSFSANSDWPLLKYYPDPGIFRKGNELLEERNRELISLDRVFGTEFTVPQMDRAPDAYLSLPPALSLFNKLHADQVNVPQFLVVRPAAAESNLLVFVHSSLGNHYYLGDRHKISFTQQESDDYLPGAQMSGIGRFFLFRVERPTSSFYLRISASKTDMAAAHKAWSRTAVIHGATDVPMNLVGGGAMNRIFGPITPVWRHGVAYIAVDFGEVPAPFPIRRTGLAALYHAWIPLDYRRLIGFGRDFTALSADEVKTLPRPRRIDSFPADIAGARGLEYSGVYEDGWLSPQADIFLGSAHAGESVRITGIIPEIEGKSPNHEVGVTVNDGRSWRFSAAPGPFDWRIPVENAADRTKVSLRFSGASTLVLPGGDDRPVGARLQLMEIAGSPAGGDWSGGQGPHFPSEGVDSDGWAETSAELWLPWPSGGGRGTIRVEFPGWPGVPGTGTLRVLADGREIGGATLKPGENTLNVVLPPGPAFRHLQLEAPQAFRLPDPDGRTRAYRLLSVKPAPVP